jgi:protein-tyrosine phosphatase
MISSPRSRSLYLRATDGPAFVQARFGSVRGLARLGLSRAASSAGAYRAFERVEWGQVRRLVFVCSGNICRSPYAERRAVLAGFPSISAALRGESGLPADPAARAAAWAAGVDLDGHRSTAIAGADLRAGDLLIAMEPWQARQLQARYLSNGVQVTLLGLWSRPKRPHLHDPFTLPDAYFHSCFQVIDSGVSAILARVDRR